MLTKQMQINQRNVTNIRYIYFTFFIEGIMANLDILCFLTFRKNTPPVTNVVTFDRGRH